MQARRAVSLTELENTKDMVDAYSGSTGNTGSTGGTEITGYGKPGSEDDGCREVSK